MTLSDHIWWNDNIKPGEKNIAAQIEYAIVDPNMFILLYIIDPDLLVFFICSKLRENKVNLRGVRDDMLEDTIGPIVHKIFKDCFMTKKTMKAFLKKIETELSNSLNNNPNHRNINS
jgi:hypothetical protein